MGKISVPKRIVRGFIRDFSQGDKERLMRKWERMKTSETECEREMERAK